MQPLWNFCWMWHWVWSVNLTWKQLPWSSLDKVRRVFGERYTTGRIVKPIKLGRVLTCLRRRAAHLGWDCWLAWEEKISSFTLGGLLTCLKMGACLAVDEAAVRSRALDKENRWDKKMIWIRMKKDEKRGLQQMPRKDWREDRRVVRLLLLGTGNPPKHFLAYWHIW